MITAIIVLLSVPVGALLYRLRGGLLNDLLGWGQKTQASRAIWSLPTGIFLWYALGGPVWEMAALSVSVFASMALIGNGDYLDPKRKQRFPDPIGALRNLIAVAPVAFFAPVGAAIYVASGLLHGKLYEFSHEETKDTKLAELLVGGLSWGVIALIHWMI